MFTLADNRKPVAVMGSQPDPADRKQRDAIVLLFVRLKLVGTLGSDDQGVRQVSQALLEQPDV